MASRGIYLCLLAASVVSAGGLPARAAAKPAGAERPPPVRTVRISIGDGSLSAALRELARRTGLELLYDQKLVRGVRAPGIRGNFAPEDALSRLLIGTGIAHRRTGEGTIVLFVKPAQPSPIEAPEVVPEILVVGRRTQNADIRRTQNDIQPYRVTTRADLEDAHRDNIDQYMRSRVPANADFAAPAQNTFVESGSVRSQINLRGLGPLRTLVLVDGRRMPSLPTGASDYLQPDLNGIPLTAIDRIETLTGTAGGIYGPGAIGGVVNIVLRRDYRGAEIRMTSGISSRGDNARSGIEGRLGFSPDGGRTDVMILAAYSRSEPLLTEDRDYFLRARERRFANNPAAYVNRQFTANSVGVLSRSGNLVLDPEKGGTPLGSTFTFLPIDFSGTQAERLALLVANAGKVDLSLPRDESVSRRSLIARPEVISVLANVRHRFGSNIEAFADLIYYSNAGMIRDNPGSQFQNTRADAPNNPFAQVVSFSYPEPNVIGEAGQEAEMRRATLGLIADLPGGWAANADYASGRAVSDLFLRRVVTSRSFGNAIREGRPDPGRPPLEPLGDWATFVAASATYLSELSTSVRYINRFSDASVRLAGPLAMLPGGALTLTLLGESRREHVRPAIVDYRSETFNQSNMTPDRSLQVRSAHAELRAPLVPDSSRTFLRGLELQLAARQDSTRTVFPVEPAFGFPSNDDLLRIKRRAFTFTGGVRFLPLPSLMLRASVATGELPPSIQQLSTISSFISGFNAYGVLDRLRGNRPVGTEGMVEELRGGRSTIRSERARTINVGFVLNPLARRRPRIAVDFSRIDRRREVLPFLFRPAAVLLNENLYPGRVVREPLGEEDRQAGFTAGRVSAIDLRSTNEGRSQVDTVDAQFDWRFEGPAGGEVRLSADATWQPRFTARRSRLEGEFSRIGHIDGPLRLRGNVGAEWSRKSTTMGLNAQYYSGYRVTYSEPSQAGLNAQILLDQGAERIGAQAYIDFYARQALPVAGQRVELGLGILNLLDTSPPILTQLNTPGYSLYGDARRRRFELSLSARFR
jgi:outer membrane receptor protein involved in Fe transport